MVKDLSVRSYYSRARRWGGIVALLVFVVVAILYARLTDPERVRRQCETYLARFVDGEVVVSGASFRLFEGINLRGVRIAEAGTGDDPDARPFFACHNLLLKHDPLGMLVGRLAVDEVVAVDAVCNLVRHDETGQYNLSRVFRGSTREGGRGKPRLPTVRLRNASLVVSREDAGGRRDVDRVNISVVAEPVSEDTRAYTVTWKRLGAEPTTGRSRFDLKRLAVKDLGGGLPWLSLETGMLVVATQVPDADRWFNLLGLRGRIKAEGYDVSFRGGAERESRVTLRLGDASLSIPGDEFERSLPREQRYLRFERVDGAIRFSPDSAEVEFGGMFHGAPCRVSATLTGAVGPQADLGDVAVSAKITCTDFTLPDVGGAADPATLRFVRRWRTLRSFYNDLDPHGRISMEASLTKAAGTDQAIRLEHGLMTVLHADGTHRKFPYRVDNITGAIEVTPAVIFLRNLAGDHSGAPVVVNGTLAEARWYAETDLRITGRGIALDGALRDAVNDRYREIWDTFALGGAADIDVRLHRPAGTAEDSHPTAVAVDAELHDARAKFARLPYPVEGLSGRVSIEGDRLRVTKLTGYNGDARVVVDGHADLAQRGLIDLNLRLDAAGVEFDDQLLGALPDDARAQVERFSPAGEFDLAGELAYDVDAGRTTYDLTVALHDARMTYQALPVPVERVRGSIRLQPHRITIEQLSGRRGDSTVTVDGTFAAAGSGGGSLAVVRCENLLTDDAVLAALPERMRGICRNLRIAGPVGAVTRYERAADGDDATAKLVTTVDVAGVSIDPVDFVHPAAADEPRHSYPLAIAEGVVTVEPGRVVLDGVRALHGDARVALDGAIEFDERVVEGTLVVSAEDVPLDDDLRLAVPWRWRRTWNQVGLTGAVNLSLDRLHYLHQAENAAAEWEFNGRFGLEGVGFEAGVRVEEMTGVMSGTGRVTGDPGGLSATAKIAVESATVSNRRITNARGVLEKSAQDGVVVLRDLSAEIYDGLASADVRAEMGSSRSTYDVSATLRGVDLRAFHNAGKDPAATRDTVAGKLDAHIYMSGTSGDPQSRRGGGRVSIHDADLYRLPLIAAILNVINFTIPEESAFQEMGADFFVTGQRVETRDIILQGTALALIGSGTVMPAEESLVLKLVAVTPHRWVNVPVITEFFEGAAREMLEIDVHGSLDAPVIQAKPLRGVEAAFETLFEGPPKKAKPVRPTKHKKSGN